MARAVHRRESRRAAVSASSRKERLVKSLARRLIVGACFLPALGCTPSSFTDLPCASLESVT